VRETLHGEEKIAFFSKIRLQKFPPGVVAENSIFFPRLFPEIQKWTFIFVHF
jgi:hypothetical protein